jgi:uncharacterized protein (TIGR02246 family)
MEVLTTQMRATAITAFLLFLFSTATCSTQAQMKPSEADAAAIKHAIAAYTDAFNHHDGHAQAMTYTEDADLTNTRGMSYHGRKEIEGRFTFNFGGRYKDAHRTDTISKIWLLTPELALVQARFEMTGAKADDGSVIPVRKGLIDPLMRKQPDGHWLIAVFHEAEFQTPAPK